MSVHVHDGPLPAPTVAQVHDLAHTAADHDGVPPLGEQTLLDLADPGAPVRHLTVGEPAQGYAVVDLRSRPSIELVVAPAARRRGLGGALLAAAWEVAGRDGVGPPAVWAHGDLPEARSLAARVGLIVRRELWQMDRDLADLPPIPVAPDGVVVRPFVVGRDEDAWLAVNARAFADHPEQGRTTLADLSAREREPWFRAEDLLLAERAGELVAFVWIKVVPGEPGELYVLGVDPSAQGAGLGRLLTGMALHHLAARGGSQVVLYTEATSTAAVRTYTAAGFRRSQVDVHYS